MKVFFIDKFFVPKPGIDEFVKQMNYNRNFIRELSGFINDAVYKRTDEEGNLVCVTVAEWKNEEALNRAKKAVKEEYKRINFNPAEMFERLNITAERGIYQEMKTSLD